MKLMALWLCGTLSRRFHLRYWFEYFVGRLLPADLQVSCLATGLQAKLLHQKLIVGHVLIKGPDDPISPGPDISSQVFFISLCISRPCQPASPHRGMRCNVCSTRVVCLKRNQPRLEHSWLGTASLPANRWQDRL
jgi:hypothetical protein